jgi:predicted cupin superfamily sugar epimerase
MTEPSSAVRALIDRFDLAPHPEGGWFCETWRSPVSIEKEALPEGYSGPRPAMTSILFLLPTGASSTLHRVASEELWLHHQGDDVALGIGATVASASDPASRVCLGQGAAASLQVIVPAGEWQTAEAMPGDAGYALVGCVVAPGFDFADFEMVGDA